jgi:hypothetical protein
MPLRVPPRDAIEQEPDSDPTHLPDWLGNRRQRRKDRRGLRDIIKPDDRNILRHAAPRSLQRADGADCHLVIEGKDSGDIAASNHPSLQELLSRGRAPIWPAIASYKCLRSDCQPGIRQRSLETGDPPRAGSLVTRPNQAGHAMVAEVDQILSGEIAALVIVN